MAEDKGQRLSMAETRRLLDAYLGYRFGRVLSGPDFAKKAGVPDSAIQDLFNQKQVAEGDLNQIARSIGVSAPLLADIAGYREMPRRMLQTLDRFFRAVEEYRSGQKKAA